MEEITYPLPFMIINFFLIKSFLIQHDVYFAYLCSKWWEIIHIMKDGMPSGMATRPRISLHYVRVQYLS